MASAALLPRAKQFSSFSPGGRICPQTERGIECHRCGLRNHRRCCCSSVASGTVSPLISRPPPALIITFPPRTASSFPSSYYRTAEHKERRETVVSNLICPLSPIEVTSAPPPSIRPSLPSLFHRFSLIPASSRARQTCYGRTATFQRSFR